MISLVVPTKDAWTWIRDKFTLSQYDGVDTFYLLSLNMCFFFILWDGGMLDNYAILCAAKLAKLVLTLFLLHSNCLVDTSNEVSAKC
jgi:hypothetical protein